MKHKCTQTYSVPAVCVGLAQVSIQYESLPGCELSLQIEFSFARNFQFSPPHTFAHRRPNPLEKG
jgi:hypothetical protein